MPGCTKPTNGNVNFQIDITNGANTTLNIVGGYVIYQNTIIIRYSTNTFYALSDACPNDGTVVIYDPGTVRVTCPSDGSTFNPATGSVITGPATKGLIKYTVTQSGNILTIRD